MYEFIYHFSYTFKLGVSHREFGHGVYKADQKIVDEDDLYRLYMYASSIAGCDPDALALLSYQLVGIRTVAT